MRIFVFDKVENIVEKEKILVTFQQYFQKAFYSKPVFKAAFYAPSKRMFSGGILESAFLSSMYLSVYKILLSAKVLAGGIKLHSVTALVQLITPSQNECFKRVCLFQSFSISVCMQSTVDFVPQRV